MAGGSAIFGVWRSMGEALEGADWPEHPTTGTKPVVDDWAASEAVVLLRNADDESAIEWVRMGGTKMRDERFVMDILIRCQTPGVASRSDLCDRLEKLHDVVHAMFVDVDSGQWTAPWKGEAWAVELGGVQSVSPRILHETEGWVGECRISVRVAVRK